MNTNYELTSEMKNDLLAKDTYAYDVEQIDWNLFIFYYPKGKRKKELRNVLLWDRTFEIESYKKLQYGLYLITDSCGDLLMDTRIMCNITIGSFVSYEEISPNVYLCQMEMDYSGKRRFTLYHTEYTDKKKEYILDGFDQEILLFDRYEKLSETFYLLYDEENTLLYNIVYDWRVCIEKHTEIAKDVYWIETNHKGCGLVTAKDIVCFSKEESFDSYKSAGRILIMKKNYSGFCFLDIHTGKKSNLYSGVFDFELYEEKEDSVIFTSFNGSVCEVFYDTLAFKGWRFA
ncbi:hypothetical protein [Chryseobacterium oryctis]|uniref:Uncharacterized protein n=1 Tax=Chryseobacterium oryctis TaxID=2952618 RepID=A0ABT3HIS6_9FLAO|nr:hypothetical protein [Chryseobacterium oryctis]MCW3159687.1 hypothetical protein [Chryseobacterium oryctis]